jgi:hypothetical protein
VKGIDEALARLDERCSRAEYEYPRLAAPDGTVAVPIGDLRLAINAAQGTEAQRAETATKIDGSVHDGPVGEADAP